jgi:hypothetical protein
MTAQTTLEGLGPTSFDISLYAERKSISTDDPHVLHSDDFGKPSEDINTSLETVCNSPALTSRQPVTTVDELLDLSELKKQYRRGSK